MQLGQKQPDGATLREHLMAAMRQSGRADSRLLQRIPAAGKPLWHAFSQLNRSRSGGFSGPSAISPQDTLAWCQLHGIRFTPWELDTLSDMDAALLRASEKEQKT